MFFNLQKSQIVKSNHFCVFETFVIFDIFHVLCALISVNQIITHFKVFKIWFDNFKLQTEIEMYSNL